MKVRIERSGKRILLSSDSPIPGLMNAIPGAYWRDAAELWSFPLEMTTCHLLRERFGNRLEIGPDLLAWAKAEKARRQEAESTSIAADVKLDLLPDLAPKLTAAMESRPYQRAGVRYIADAYGRDGQRRALLADTVGLGKTLQALGALLESGAPGPYLIICPKTAVESTWRREIAKWLPEDEIITLPDGRVKRVNILNNLLGRPAPSLQRTWVVVHPAVIRTQTWFVCHELETDVAGTTAPCGGKTKYRVGPVPELDCGHEKRPSTRTQHDHTFPQLFNIPWGGIVVDESDQVLIRLSGTPNLQRRGAEMLGASVAPGAVRLAMSGTPHRSKPHQLWSTLNWLDPVRWSGKWRWIQQYWATGGYSGYEVSEECFLDDREHLLVDELRDVMLRRDRSMVRSDLPDKLYPSNAPDDQLLVPGIYLPMDREQERAYREMEKTGSANLDGGTIDAIGTLAELTRLKQFATCRWHVGRDGQLYPIAIGNKFDWLTEFMLELGFPERPSTKLVIVSQFTRVINAFATSINTHFKFQPRRIGAVTGEIPQQKRSQYIDEFEDDRNRRDIMFLNIKAGGSSITLDAADVMVFLDETFVSDDHEQAEGRIDNRNPEKRIAPRSFYYLRSAGTLEEGIAAANAEAKRRGERILNGAAIARRAKEFVNR